MKHTWKMAGAAAAGLLLSATAANADCQKNILMTYVGSDHALWLTFDDASTAEVLATHPAFQSILSIAITAQTSRRPVLMRWTETSCAGQHTGVIGLHLL
jgi:hypothetical protein